MSITEKLRLAEGVYRDAGLPLVLRITPFSQPEGLDAALQAAGMHKLDDTRVMVAPLQTPATAGRSLPEGCRFARTDAAAYAEIVGQFRGSPPAQRTAQAQRQALSPVPFESWLVQRREDIVACGQFARESDLVGLYDVFTSMQCRGQGIAHALCAELLRRASLQGATTAYLQVEADNLAARAVYHRLGFVDGYSYHYRSPDAGVT